MKNLVEDAVREIYADLRARNAEYCDCEQCQDDVMAYALNNLKPRYTSGGPRAVAYTSFQLQQAGTRSELAVVVMEAMRRVAMNPRHGMSPDLPRGGGVL
jgi:competence protein ComFB